MFAPDLLFSRPHLGIATIMYLLLGMHSSTIHLIRIRLSVKNKLLRLASCTRRPSHPPSNNTYRCRTAIVCTHKSHRAYPLRIYVKDKRGVTFLSVLIMWSFCYGNSPINLACDGRDSIRILRAHGFGCDY